MKTRIFGSLLLINQYVIVARPQKSVGEGYGTMASIEYVTTDGVEVATEMLEPGWQPFKRRKKPKRIMASQRDQIFMAASRIMERDQDILLGDFHRLNDAAERWQTIKTKMGWK